QSPGAHRDARRPHRSRPPAQRGHVHGPIDRRKREARLACEIRNPGIRGGNRIPNAILCRQNERGRNRRSARLSRFIKGTLMRNPSRLLFSLLTVLATAAPAGAQAQVSAQRIERAAAEPQNWLTNQGGYDSKRYSSLNQITPTNVTNLEQKWVVQDQVFGAWESNPLVVDGI